MLLQPFKLFRSSGVSDQPMGHKETRGGAINRARNARKAFLLKLKEAVSEPFPDSASLFFVGLEGGLVEALPNPSSGPAKLEHPELECVAWMAVLQASSTGENENESWGFAHTASFTLPEKVSSLVRGGMELGHADDKVFGRRNSKQKDGAVGLLSKGLIDRREYYVHSLVLALIPFSNPSLYYDEPKSTSPTQ